MKTNRREGYFLIDHSASPGLTVEEAARLGGIAVGEGKVLEAAALTCGHCQKVSIKNPERTRERAHCFKCDHYICDDCGMTYHLTQACQTIKRQADQIGEATIRNNPIPALIGPGGVFSGSGGPSVG